MGNVASITTKDRVQDDATVGVETLDLVLCALPIIRNVARSLSRTFNKRDKRCGFLANIQSSTAMLKQQLEVVREDCSMHNYFEVEIADLANYLELILNPELVHKNGDTQGKRADLLAPNCQYKRLGALQELFSQNAVKATEFQPEMILDPKMINSSPQPWRKLQGALESITDKIQFYGDDVDDMGEGTLLDPANTGSDSEMWEFASKVFKAMTCHCHSEQAQQIRLRMGTYHAVSIFAPKSLCILLEQLDNGEEWGFWHELLIREHLKMHPRGGVRYLIPDLDDDSDGASCLYRSLLDPSAADLLRLDFVLSPGSVLHRASNITDERSLKSEDLQEEISLKEVLALPGRKWPEPAKWALAVILAWSLYHLYGGPWVRGGWSRESIVFFKCGDCIPLRPFLGVSAANRHRHDEQAGGHSTHRYPEILELGVILLEIHLGERLEDFLQLKRELITVKDFSVHAMKVFASQKQHMFSLRYRNAIDACLRPDPKLGSHATLEDVRSMLFQNVVGPLEDELSSNLQEWFSASNLDQQAEKYDLAVGLQPKARMHQSVQAQSQLRTRAVAHSSIRELPVTGLSKSFTIRTNGDSRKGRNGAEQTFELFEAFEDAESLDSSRIRQTDSWKQRFKKLVQKHSSPDTSRLKIAVLDTGINHDHMDFIDEERIKEIRSWTRDKKTTDTCGHGTHIVGTILELTENVDVYIGRIAATRTIDETDHIAEALRYAREQWRVDMISLSFGFRELVPNIQSEIDKALSSGILVFAAASNDGGNSGRAYPARHEGVFCIHSATSEGNKTPFNPTPRKAEDNFAVLGDCIQSSWLKDERKYMSGTSFATPVAVAIAAFIFAYVSRNIPEESSFPIAILSPRGMRKVFRLMKAPRDSYDWISPIWYFNEYREDKIQADIRYELTR